MDIVVVILILAALSLPIGKATAETIHKYLGRSTEVDEGTIAAFALSWFLVLVVAVVPYFLLGA